MNISASHEEKDEWPPHLSPNCAHAPRYTISVHKSPAAQHRRLGQGRADMRPALDRLAYAVAAAGIIGDHLSTRIGLMSLEIVEMNQFTCFLRQHKLWLPFDIVMLAASLGIPAALMREWRFRGRWATLAFPLLFGTARLLATVHNMITILSVS